MFIYPQMYVQMLVWDFGIDIFAKESADTWRLALEWYQISARWWFQIIFIFTLILGEMIQFDTES